MPTLTQYDSTRAALQLHLPNVISSQIDNLALMIAGVAQSQAAQMAAIARALPLDTTQESKQQRIRRLLDNPRLTQADHYHPIARTALTGLRGQRVDLLLDRVLLRDQHNILVVSIGFRRRSIPLVGQALPHRGASALQTQTRLLAAALDLLPERVQVTVHGDSEFRSSTLFDWIRAQGHDVLLSIQGRTYVYTHAGMDTSGQMLEQLVGDRQDVVYLSNVYLTQAQYGPVNVLAWWDKDDEAKPLLRAVMTNLPATARTKQRGKRRMWIETVFRDWQSGGFHLDRSGLTDRERLERLLLPLVIAYLWFVSMGRWVVKRGYRRLIDDGAARNWHYSLFQLGVGWLERLRAYNRPLAVLFYIYS